LRMAHQLDRLGVDVIEAGFPIASEGDFESVQAIAQELVRPEIAGLARANEQDIDRAWQAVRYAKHPRLHVFLATSDIHLHFKLRMSREQALERATSAIRHAKSLCDNIEFSPEDGTRTDLGFLSEVVDAVVEAGATVINIPDTVGYILPHEMSRIVSSVYKRVEPKGATVSVHCHNDLGMAVANSLAAIDAGARQVECTINGIGERAGNASLEELVMALYVRSNALPYETGIRTDQLFGASQLLTELTGICVQPNKAIVGRNAFAHEAGIHQDGVLKNPLTYEIMTPQSVGVPENTLVLGKHSGRHALGKKCHQLGYELCRRDLDRVYRRFVALADQVKIVSDDQVVAVIREELPEVFLCSQKQETGNNTSILA